MKSEFKSFRQNNPQSRIVKTTTTTADWANQQRLKGALDFAGALRMNTGAEILREK